MAIVAAQASVPPLHHSLHFYFVAKGRTGGEILREFWCDRVDLWLMLEAGCRTTCRIVLVILIRHFFFSRGARAGQGRAGEGRGGGESGTGWNRAHWT